ncbi:MAG: DUF861 domain-containing protein [Thermoleophilia bacterium]|nr:DUF861 domain-containing protein [Thermoleophilia bacterium]
MQTQQTFGDPLSLSLAPIGPRAGATRGEPVESATVLSDHDSVETGVWEVTPGTFPGRKSGLQETFVVLAGSGTITGSEGDIVELHPGAVVHQPDGWHGVWDVVETVRKAYVVTRAH